jgi:hypothetical protein
MIQNIIKLAVHLFGVLLIYLGLCLRPDEEGRIENRIELLWRAINDKNKVSSDKTTALFNRIGEIIGRKFDKILGKRLISVQMIGVSTSASFAGLFGGVGLLFLYLVGLGLSTPVTSFKPEVYASLLIVGSLCLVLGFLSFVFAALPSLWPSYVSRMLSLGPILFLILVTLEAARKHLVPVHVHKMKTLFLALFISVLSDIFLLSGARLSIRWISASMRRFRILLALLLQISIVAIVTVLPWELAGPLLARNPNNSAAEVLLYVAGLNLFTALAASAFTLTLLLVLLHRMLWPFLDRLIYPLVRFKIFQHRKIVVSLGGLLAFYPIVSSATLGKVILDWLQKRLAG